MTPAQMAKIHAAAFLMERPWREEEFAQLLTQPLIRVYPGNGGFAVARTVAGESELLTLAVAPSSQRKGIARALLAQWITDARTSADTAFLDVAADNIPALALYETSGFTRSGQRKGYYARTSGPPADAVLMTRALTLG